MTSCPNIGNIHRSNKIAHGKTVSQLLEELQTPKIQPKSTRTRPQLDINLIRSQMKKKWRDPGYSNVQFAKPPILRARLLNQWQFQRIYQAERSYKYPKGFKGIKFDRHSRQFQELNNDMLPAKFNKYLQKVKQKYEQKIFVPDHKLAEKGERIRRMLTENSVKSGMIKDHHKNGFFGYTQSLNKKKLKTFGCE